MTLKFISFKIKNNEVEFTIHLNYQRSTNLLSLFSTELFIPFDYYKQFINFHKAYRSLK